MRHVPKFTVMELASIYVDSLDLAADNTFTIDFSSKDNFQNVFFSKYTKFCITNLDCYLDLSDKVNTSTGNSKMFLKVKHDELIKKLSELSRELTSKGADFQNDIKDITLKSNLDNT